MTNPNAPMTNHTDPSNEIIERKIGNTTYIITTVCEGTEFLLAKIKCLIFDDPVFIRTCSAEQPDDKHLEPCYNSTMHYRAVG